MTYIVEKKFGKSPQFYEDVWQPYWEYAKRDYLDFGEVPPGYEVLCVTQDQRHAAVAVMAMFGEHSDEIKYLRKAWPHLNWGAVEKLARNKAGQTL